MVRVTANQNQVFAIEQQSDGLIVNQAPFEWDLLQLNPHTFHIIYQNQSYNAVLLEADYENKVFVVRINNHEYRLQAQDRFDLLLEKMGMTKARTAQLNHIKAPMPGLIIDIKVQVGDMVSKGDTMMILEAMKMENIIKSPGDGQVKNLKVKKGDSVEKNQVLIEF
ncbi:MAG: acetyl-CoA carboxylase biotin carboxyl carrier protein subunit [Bacteroidota bacterium]